MEEDPAITTYITTQRTNGFDPPNTTIRTIFWTGTPAVGQINSSNFRGDVDFLGNEQYTPIYIVSGFYGIIFLFAICYPFRGPNKAVIRSSVLLTVFCLWLLWAIVYIAQINPIVGPQFSNTTLAWLIYKYTE